MPLQIPAKLLVVVTGVLSTAASFAGGIILYFEGLALLERTIEEGSISDRSAVSTVLNDSLLLAMETAELQGHVLQKWTSLHTGGQPAIADWAFPTLFYQTWSADLYGVQIQLAPTINTRTNASTLVCLAWYDVLADGTREYIYGEYNSSVYNTICEGSVCIPSVSINPYTGKPKEMVYTYRESTYLEYFPGGVYHKSAEGWETAGVSFWRPPSVWYAYDGTPGLYLSYLHILPAMNHIPPYRDMMVAVTSFVLAGNFQKAVEGYKTPATLVLVDYQGRGRVLASNIGVVLSKEGCSNDAITGEDCLAHIEDLPPEYAEGARTLNHTSTGRFVRTDKLWVGRTELFKPTPRDMMEGITLLWMRSISSVEKELDRALGYFIFFVVLVLVLDVAIGVAEVLLIARPLGKLSESMESVRNLNTDRLELQLAEVLGCFRVGEIATLVAGVRYAGVSLREFKSYLPQTVFQVDDSDSSDETVVSSSRHHSRKSSVSSASSVGSKAPYSANLGVHVSNTSLIAVVLETSFADMALHSLAFAHSSWLQVMQNTQRTYRATIQRIMGERVLVTWTKDRIVGWAAKAVEFTNTVVQNSKVRTVGGIAGGPAVAGKMGTSTLRAFNAIGKSESIATILVELNRPFKTSILVEGTVANSLTSSSAVAHRPIDRIITRHCKKPVVISEVIVGGLQHHDSWMYAMESKMDKYHRVWGKLMERSFEEATLLLTSLREEAGDPALDALAGRIASFVAFHTGNPMVSYCNTLDDKHFTPSAMETHGPTVEDV